MNTMDRPISAIPSGTTPQLALEALFRSAESLLDVGCGSGHALRGAYELGVKTLYGIEIDREAAAAARRLLAGIEVTSVFHGSADELPLPDGSVDLVTCFEVLEHVPAGLRMKVIDEIRRVLRTGGRFALTTPHRGLFHFLDPANFRFHFPRLHRRVSRLIGGGGRDRGYEGEKHGVEWHHHFTVEELRQLLGNAFEIEYIRFRGCVISPLAGILEWPFYRRRRTDHAFFRLIRRVHEAEMDRDFGPCLGCNVMLIARKANVSRGPTGPAPASVFGSI